MTRRRVFVSYQHTALDQHYRNEFENLFSSYYNIFISKSVQIGDLDPNLSTDYVRQVIRDQYLSDSTVTVVLIGPTTWQRKHVDWEISSSIRQTQHSSRSGLLGILLPNHPSFGASGYDSGICPPRLVDNQRCGYAAIYDWNTDPAKVSAWIEAAYQRRSSISPDNSYPHYVNNKFAERWT
jgi:hypothetical protein